MSAAETGIFWGMVALLLSIGVALRLDVEAVRWLAVPFIALVVGFLFWLIALIAEGHGEMARRMREGDV